VVLVALNRGFPKPKRDGGTGVKPPDFYVLPISYVTKVRDPSNPWGKIVRKRLVNLEEFKDKWVSISDFLQSGRSNDLPAHSRLSPAS